MIGWLGGLLGMGKIDAYQLLTPPSLSPITNMVDPNFSAVVKVAEDLPLPCRPTARCTSTCAHSPLGGDGVRRTGLAV